MAEVNSEGLSEFEVLHQIRRADLTAPGGRFSRTSYSELGATRCALRLEDARLNRVFGAADSVRWLRLVSVLCVPLLDEGEVVTRLHIEGSRPGQFSAGRQVLEECARLRIEVGEILRALAEDQWFARFVGKFVRLRELQQELFKAARLDFPVLPRGESGTDKIGPLNLTDEQQDALVASMEALNGEGYADSAPTLFPP